MFMVAVKSVEKWALSENRIANYCSTSACRRALSGPGIRAKGGVGALKLGSTDCSWLAGR